MNPAAPRHIPVLERVPIKVFSTGMNTTEGQPDPHWQVVAVSNEPTFRARPALVSRAAPQWLTNDSTTQSQWISVVGDASSLPFDVTYTFRTTFELAPGERPDSAKLTGWFLVDNHVQAIRLNGHEVVVLEHGYFNYELFRRFSIARGFVTGTNVLEFDVFNGAPGMHEGPYNPMGLRADFQGSVYQDSEK